MKSKKILFVGAATLAAIVSFSFGVANNKSYANVSDVTVANIEAFTTARALDCEYKRIDENCEVTISPDIDVKSLGINIVKAVGNGTFIIEGKVVCQANGEETCRPVECIDIYELIMSSGKN